MIKLSICIPTYNRSKFISTCISSISQAINTKNEDLVEIIVSDNASPDNTEEVIKALKIERLRYYRNNENLGFKMNFLKLLDYVSGEYILFMSDEDRMSVDAIDKILEIIPRAPSFIFGSIKKENGQPYYRFKRNRNLRYPASLKLLLYGHSYLTGYCVRRDLINRKQLTQIVENSVHQVYPHEMISQLNLADSQVYLLKDFLFRQGKVDEINSISKDEKYYYFHPDNRIKQFEETLAVISQLKDSQIDMLKVKKVLTDKAVSLACHPGLKKNYPELIDKYISNLEKLMGFNLRSKYLYKKIYLMIRKFVKAFWKVKTH